MGLTPFKTDAAGTTFQEGVLVLDPSTGRFVAGNPAACELLACSRQVITGMGPSDLHPQLELEELVGAVESSGAYGFWRADDVLIVRPDQSTFRAGVTLCSMPVGGQTLLLETFHCAHQLTNLNRCVEAVNSLEPLGILAHGITHELKNALTHVIYNLECLADMHPIRNGSHGEAIAPPKPGCLSGPRQPDAGEEMSRLVQSVQSGVDSIRKLADGMSAICRIDQTAPSDLDLNAVIEKAVALVHHETKYRAGLTVDLAPGPLLVHASLSALTNVLVSLFLRAARAADEGRLEENQIQVRTWTASGRAAVQISDTGRSTEIDPVESPFPTCDHAGFADFLQSRRMAHCQALIREAGGELHALRLVGQGNAVTVWLPLQLTSSSSSGGIDRAESHGRNELELPRVLVVDDDPGVCDVLRRIIQRGYEVTTVSSVRAARELLIAQDFDAIVSDIEMPGLSGLSLLDWLTARDPDAASKLIFVTGGVLSAKTRQRLDELKNPCLDKPFVASRVLEFVGLVAPRRRPPTKVSVESGL